MSDEPERVFSVAGNVLAPSRRRLTSEVMQWLLCLRSWQKSEIIKLDQRLLRAVVIQVDSLPLPPLLDDDEDDDEDDDSMDEIITPEIV